MLEELMQVPDDIAGQNRFIAERRAAQKSGDNSPRTSLDTNGPDFGPYKTHPVLDLFPMEVDKEWYRGLIRSIADEGLALPITLSADGTTIVDGRHRYLACIEAGVEPTFKKLNPAFEEEHVIAFINSANTVRTHLTDEQVADICAKAAQYRQSMGWPADMSLESEPPKPTEPPTGWRVSYVVDAPFVELQPQKPKSEDFVTRDEAIARADQLRADGYVASVAPAGVKPARNSKGRATGRRPR